jgi:alginate O-acetyltransferase complex protein AlgI
MLFNSYLFIFLFLPIVLIVYIYLRRKSSIWPIMWIVFASLIYYGWWKPEFLLLLLGSIGINLIFGKIILNKKITQSKSRIVLITGIIFNLSLLGYFKYAGFFVSNINELFSVGLPNPSIILPIGISFITFQKIAFLVDAHKGLVRNFSILNYMFFVTFFPQLIAGPIVHHAEVMPQLSSATRRNLNTDFAIGMSIFIVGLFKKIIIADTLAVYADAGYAMIKGGNVMDTASAWITVVAYALQLYFDFSGYSDMAIGLGRMFGIKLPLNFYSPYKAHSIIDFWRRWHMTLSRFLRDYLYFPLGGNRHGGVRRYLNLAIVMLLGGLWHGANWTFAVWGGVHGLLLTLNHAWRKLPFTQHRLYRSRPVRVFAIAITFMLITLAWIPFRAENLSQTSTMLSYLFPHFNNPLGFKSFVYFWHEQFGYSGFSDWFKPHELWPSVLPANYLATAAHPLGIVLVVCLLAVFLFPTTSQIFGRFEPALSAENQPGASSGSLNCLNGRVACILGFMFVLSILKLAHVSPFLYFQF